jgi:hypothetical protein
MYELFINKYASSRSFRLIKNISCCEARFTGDLSAEMKYLGDDGTNKEKFVGVLEIISPSRGSWLASV